MFNISETFKNCKEKLLSYERPTEGRKIYEKDIFIFFLIITTGFLGFGLGRLSRIFENKTPIRIENATDASLINSLSQNNATSNPEAAPHGRKDLSNEIEQNTEKNFVASKNGTKYYFPWCEGINKIKEENKVWFSTKEEAVKKGYEPARNCKGL